MSYSKYTNQYGDISGFTFVELIVVSTILVILGAVGFSAYTSYISGARDSNRIAQLASIHDGLNLATSKGALPIPDGSIDIVNGIETIAYQGYAGKSALDTIGFQKGGKDPKDDTYFSYYLDVNRSSFQLMTLLEDNNSETANIFDTAYANDYALRHPSLYGKELGILTDISNTPIQEIDTIKTAGNLNIGSTTDTYKAHISGTNIITGASTELKAIQPDTSCERINQARGARKSQYYTINPLGDGVKYRIYCNMNGENPNLLADQSWSPGTGTDGNYVDYGDESENTRVVASNHLGVDDIIWQAKSTDTGAQDGGWINSSISLVDQDKTYRVSVWVKRTGGSVTDGNVFLGTDPGVVEHIVDGSTTANPYFFSSGKLPALDTWYLVVGYLHPVGYTETITKGGIYSTSSATKVANISRDYKQLDGEVINTHRTFMHSINNAAITQHMYDPRFEEIPASKVGDVSDILPVRL